jgi:hypothetical protein
MHLSQIAELWHTKGRRTRAGHGWQSTQWVCGNTLTAPRDMAWPPLFTALTTHLECHQHTRYERAASVHTHVQVLAVARPASTVVGWASCASPVYLKINIRGEGGGRERDQKTVRVAMCKACTAT